MNQRILELADEARIKFSSHWAHEGVDTAVITRRDLKEFAELIVRDVLDEVLQAMDDGMDVYDTVADKFGVEE